MTTRTIKYSYRAYPTASQQKWLAGAFGAVRVVYNDYLWQREQIFQGTQSTLLTPLDKYNLLPTDKAWLRAYPQKIAEQARRQADRAYQDFFKGLAGKRKNRVGKPKYKRKRAGGSLTWNGSGVLKLKRLNRRWMAVRLPKQGSWLKFKLSRELPSAPTGVTLKLSPAGEYTLSFTVQEQLPEPKIEGPVAGVDTGLIDLVTVVQDDGTRYKVTAPKHYRRAERKLARLQKSLSRKQKGSKNWEKARLSLARQHSVVAAARLDYNRKIAAKLASENQAVSFEDLNLRGLIKSKLGKSFADAGLSQLVACVEQATVKRGARFSKVDPAFTTQACCSCGVISGRKPLSQREWVCDCGLELDRDFNAAVNILLAGGHSERLNDLGGRIRRSQLAGLAMPVEEVTSYKAYKPCRRRTRAKSQARRAQLKAQTLV